MLEAAQSPGMWWRQVTPAAEIDQAMRLDRAKILSEIATAWLGLIALLIGGIFAIVQYLSQQEDGRVKETLSMYQQYNKGAIHESNMIIFMAWETREKELDAVLDASPFSPQTYYKEIIKIIDEEKLLRHIFVLISFFDALDVCVNENICDAKVALMLFHQDACAFYHLHFAKIAEVRQRRKEAFLAIQLQHFVAKKSCGRNP